MEPITKPEGVVFLVENKPFTKTDKKIISGFIKADKLKNKSGKPKSKKKKQDLKFQGVRRNLF
jgi:hypothetical protein